MYQATSCSGYYHGRSCPLCTRCFHRCSARIPTIPSIVDCNFVRMGEYFVSCSSDISRVRECFRMTVHHDVARDERSKIRASYVGVPAELSRYHAHATEIVTRQNRGIAPKTHENSRHDRFQYTVMLLVISAARFVHYMSVLLFELSRYHSLNGNIIENAGETSCTCEAHGGADRNHDVIFRANAKKCMPGHVLELFVPALMLPRACAVHARNAHSRREHKMGD